MFSPRRYITDETVDRVGVRVWVTRNVVSPALRTTERRRWGFSPCGPMMLYGERIQFTSLQLLGRVYARRLIALPLH